MCKATDFLLYYKSTIPIATQVGETLKLLRSENFMTNYFGAINKLCKALTKICMLLLNKSLKFHICLKNQFSATGHKNPSFNNWFFMKHIIVIYKYVQCLLFIFPEHRHRKSLYTRNIGCISLLS